MLPKLAIWSLFRDDAGENIARYRQRIEALDYPPDLLRLYLAEGDSQDATYDELRAWSIEDGRITVTKFDTGLRRHGHTADPERFHILASMANPAIEAIGRDDWADYAVLVESDLIYDPDTFKRLLANKLDETDPQGGLAKPCVIAPMVWLIVNDTLRFYDVWAFRSLDGHNFPPANPAWFVANWPGEPFEVESVGSLVFFPMDAVKAGAHYNKEVIRGMALMAREAGHRVFCDPTTNIFHPPIAGVGW